MKRKTNTSSKKLRMRIMTAAWRGRSGSSYRTMSPGWLGGTRVSLLLSVPVVGGVDRLAVLEDEVVDDEHDEHGDEADDADPVREPLHADVFGVGRVAFPGEGEEGLVDNDDAAPHVVGALGAVAV